MIYWDNNATTPILPEVREAMLPFLGEVFANPSSPYTAARRAGRAISEARLMLAELLDSPPDQLFFTSGGTESTNQAFHLARLSRPDRRHIVTATTEHASVLACAEAMERDGYQVTVLPVDDRGQISLDRLQESIREDTLLVSIMAANNETGVLHPIAEIADRVRRCGVYFHCDGVQAVGKIPVSLRSLAPDFFTVSGHKFHGPKGSGALYVSRDIGRGALLVGGDQEFGRRAGTENVMAIAGMGAAACVARGAIGSDKDDLVNILKFVEDKILTSLPKARFLCADLPRLPNTRLLVHPGVEAEAVIALLDERGICLSSGSACASGSAEPSHVLRAMGVTDSEVRSALRLSTSRLNTREEADRVGTSLVEIIHRLSSLNG